MKKRFVEPSTWEGLRIDERIEEEHRLFGTIDGAGSTSDAITQSLRSEYGYKGEILFLPPCIDTERYHPMELAEDDPIWEFLASNSSGLSPREIRGRKLVTEISRVAYTKRKDLLIRAFVMARKKHPEALLLVSIDEVREDRARELRELIAAEGIEKDTIVVGSVFDELPKIYAASYLYCTPSVSEGFGMSIQEAAASRVATVSSEAVPFAVEYMLGDRVEKIAGGEYGLRKGKGTIIATSDDVAGFARAMELLLADPSYRDAMAQNAYEMTIPNFTWTRFTRQFLNQAKVEIPGEGTVAAGGGIG